MARRKRRSNFPRPTGSTTARGYGGNHQSERKRWEPLIQTGRVACVCCGFLILAGEAWHLDHRDDRLGYLGVSHALCNLRAAGQKRNAIKYGRNPSRDW